MDWLCCLKAGACYTALLEASNSSRSLSSPSPEMLSSKAMDYYRLRLITLRFKKPSTDDECAASIRLHVARPKSRLIVDTSCGVTIERTKYRTNIRHVDVEAERSEVLGSTTLFSNILF